MNVGTKITSGNGKGALALIYSVVYLDGAGVFRSVRFGREIYTTSKKKAGMRLSGKRRRGRAFMLTTLIYADSTIKKHDVTLTLADGRMYQIGLPMNDVADRLNKCVQLCKLWGIGGHVYVNGRLEFSTHNGGATLYYGR